MATKKEKELPLEESPRWTVVPVYKRRTTKQKHRNVAPILKHWSLRYDERCKQTAVAERDVERLREMAKLFNQKKARPKDITRGGDLHFDLFPELTPPPAKSVNP